MLGESFGVDAACARSPRVIGIVSAGCARTPALAAFDCCTPAGFGRGPTKVEVANLDCPSGAATAAAALEDPDGMRCAHTYA